MRVLLKAQASRKCHAANASPHHAFPASRLVHEKSISKVRQVKNLFRRHNGWQSGSATLTASRANEKKIGICGEVQSERGKPRDEVILGRIMPSTGLNFRRSRQHSLF